MANVLNTEELRTATHTLNALSVALEALSRQNKDVSHVESAIKAVVESIRATYN